MCSGEKRKTAHTIFRSIKIWFLLQMKTIGPYNVAAAWGHVHNHALITHPPGRRESTNPFDGRSHGTTTVHIVNPRQRHLVS